MRTWVGSWRELAASGEKNPKAGNTHKHWIYMRLLPIALGQIIIFTRSERDAARLAHQSGGLGVASSNLAAPTKLHKQGAATPHLLADLDDLEAR